ncbi:hypothetical protein [Clostridium paridis]|uniref:Uncharacterized protein n=1 Tax=Clostridium paridis TaxID=2803863 RepID=A0A937FHC6_9CLOT|nr:hypothetical protein [Clostridium paridis]MBL4933173.1 hypothetical protein [Clostridium paridis]
MFKKFFDMIGSLMDGDSSGYEGQDQLLQDHMDWMQQEEQRRFMEQMDEDMRMQNEQLMNDMQEHMNMQEQFNNDMFQNDFDNFMNDSMF